MKTSLFGASLLAALALFGTASGATLISLGKPATASNYAGAQYPELVTDGLYGYGQHWSAGSYATQWVTIDLEQVYSISSINVIGPLWFYNVSYNVVFDLKGSLDNSNWTVVGSADLKDTTDMALRSKDFDLSGDSYRYIQLYFTGGSHHSSAAEISVYAVPEPSTAAILIGAACLCTARRRRK